MIDIESWPIHEKGQVVGGGWTEGHWGDAHTGAVLDELLTFGSGCIQ